MSGPPDISIIDVSDETTFGRLPPCADPRFDHRSCDYWEDGIRGSKAARASWWQERRAAPKPRPQPAPDNPFAPPPKPAAEFNPFSAASAAEPGFNPFAPAPEVDADAAGRLGPRKLGLLDRGRVVFGSYAKILLVDDEPVVYAQFGPLSAYPRAQHVRELYPRLPQSPLPAVITCVATTAESRKQGYGRLLVEDITGDLARRGFAAVEAYPDLTLDVDEASAATPAFWLRCAFVIAVDDDRYPVMRRELG